MEILMKDIFYGFIRDIKTLRLVWSTSGFTDYTQEVLGYFRQLGKLLGFSVRAEKKRYDLSWYRESEKIPFLHIEHENSPYWKELKEKLGK